MDSWPRRRSLVVSTLGVALLLTACATALPELGPADVPRLQSAVAEAPDDFDLQTQLGIALYRSDRFEEARDVLTAVVESGEAGGAAYLFLGLANESLEDWTAARQAYSAYLDAGRWDPLKEQIRDRLLLIARNELRAQARQALAQESELTTQPPTPRTVAVFPFRLVSDDESLEPLQVALADMMITDLSISNAVTVLERTQIQSLLDEMALSEAGYTEAATGARAGRLLRAEHVVQGALTTLGDETLRFDADVLNTERASSAGRISDEDRLEALFDMEKEVVFRVLEVLGAELTPAERQAINENRAENLLAFLAYGQGLQALDRGDYQAAQQFFDQAVQLDPGFGAAGQARFEAEGLGDAAGQSPDDLANNATGETGGVTGVPGTDRYNTDLLRQTAGDVNPSPSGDLLDQGTTGDGARKQTDERDPQQEAGNGEGPTSTRSRLPIRIRRPGGGSSGSGGVPARPGGGR
ncbi:MAG: hypothetical protein D6701_08715 [Gemmatimonadetes bacterium]|nr:MAG: hypothetical protein D6701_08715 [Gemmatimonadota bacterium]